MGYIGHETSITGLITLPLSLGVCPKIMTEMIDLLVVDLTSACNGIIRRPYQMELEIISSVKHILIKLSITKGIEQLKSNQQLSRNTYLTALKRERNKKRSRRHCSMKKR